MLPPRGFEEIAKEKLALATELADMQKMNQVRARVEAIVQDPATASALQPWFRQFCKRPCFHDEYLQTYNRPSVTLVDTHGLGVERITPQGVVVAGVEYPVDCLIFATGFEVGTSYTRRAGHEIVGRHGQRLGEKWAEGPSTFHGLHSHGFPNCYFMGFVQSVLSANVPHVLNEQARHIAFIMRELRARGATVAEATAEAEAGWVSLVEKTARAGERFFAECTPGYYNNEGKPTGRREKLNGSGYPDGLVGEDIPLLARILRVVDCYDAMTSARAYHAPRAHAEVMEILESEAGTKADPMVFRAFVRSIERNPARAG